MFVNYCNKESQATQVGSHGIYSTGLSQEANNRPTLITIAVRYLWSKAKLMTNVGNKDNVISSIPYIKGLYSYQLFISIYEVSTLNGV